MLIPKRTKYRKPHRLTYDGHAKGNTELHFGEYGLMAKEGAYVSAKQIEAARIAMTRYMKRGGKVFINIFPSEVDEATAREALRLASHKLPVTCKFVKKEGNSSEN